ncbi:alpha/beta fold hydrolase [uncultured Bradyrhizobium sp.]|uniref:alpha/beta fold hydrolase n=1 Tax=uncultured Bradyrhizobium sp. TaxID=199684 RepID=UPI0035CB3DF0
MIEHTQGAPKAACFSYLPPSHRNAQLVRDGAIFERSTVKARDGRPLTVFEAGDRAQPTVLLVNALGMSVLFLAALARHLAPTHHVVAWETRGLPDASNVELNDDLTIARHAEDAADVLAGMGCKADAVVSYCSGVNVATYGLTHGLLSTSKLCVVSPSIELPTAQEQTDYQRTMLPIWRSVAASGLRQAALIQQLLQESQDSQPDGVHAELHQLNNLPFLSAESTYLYARMQAACLEQASLERLSSLKAATLVIHCNDDDLIHADTAKAFAAAVAGSRYEQLNDAGHFGIYTSNALHRLVADFILGNRTVEKRPTSQDGAQPALNR